MKDRMTANEKDALRLAGVLLLYVLLTAAWAYAISLLPAMHWSLAPLMAAYLAVLAGGAIAILFWRSK